jgi:predicted dehydrogenase
MIAGHSEPEPIKKSGMVRYGVVGLGHIAQAAVLPAFKNAKKNSALAALVSDDPVKLKKLGHKYKINTLCSYDQYDELLKSGKIDAVYICLPNTLHRDYTERAARAGIHVLCEKPMATTAADCEAMIRAADENDIRLMIAYRLHFEEANLKAMELAHSGKLGDLRIFNSVFCMQVEEGNIRTRKAMGGGPLYDIGIYCINAARYIFSDEPTEVSAFLANKGDDPRFKEVEEMASVTMRFPGERLATFTCSFGAASTGAYQVVGTKGDLCVDPGYEYQEEITHYVTINDKTKEKSFAQRDQFAPELLYFSKCVIDGIDPEPNGWEGLADIRIIEAIFQSAREGRPVKLQNFEKKVRPGMGQEIQRPPMREPDLIHVDDPSAT